MGQGIDVEGINLTVSYTTFLKNLPPDCKLQSKFLSVPDFGGTKCGPNASQS